jgi:hypothetical protein
MYMEHVYKRISRDELESLTREIEMCRDAGGNDEYESYLAEYVAAQIYTEVEIQFVTYKRDCLYHAFVLNTETGHTERNHGQSKVSFWTAFRFALIGLGMAKIEPDQEWGQS